MKTYIGLTSLITGGTLFIYALTDDVLLSIGSILLSAGIYIMLTNFD